MEIVKPPETLPPIEKMIELGPPCTVSHETCSHGQQQWNLDVRAYEVKSFHMSADQSDISVGFYWNGLYIAVSMTKLVYPPPAIHLQSI